MRKFRKNDFWWMKWVGGKELTKNVCDSIRWIDDNQGYRREQILDSLRMYGGFNVSGLGVSEYSRVRGKGDIKINIIRSVVDTLVSQIATSETRPYFLTEKGDREKQLKAKRLTRFAGGVLHQTGFTVKTAKQVLRDACVFGKGFAKVHSRNSDIIIERTFPGEILIDDVEAKYGDPRQLFQVKEVSRELLMSLYPEKATEIENAGIIRTKTESSTSSVSDPVSLVEAWHLKDYVGSGRHVICLSDGEPLLDEEYDGDTFPFSQLDYGDPILGFWPNSLVDDLKGIQIEINYILKKIQSLMTLATSQVWVQRGSMVNTSRLSNIDFAINEYVGSKPEFMAVQSVSPEYFTHLDRLIARAYDIAGISQLAAQAKKPQGLDSGVALREFKDSQTQRFSEIEKAYERFAMDVTNLAIEEAKRIEENSEGGFSVVAKGDKEIEKIKWRQVDMDRDSYVLQSYPTSMLPKTPAAKIQTAGEFAQQFPEIRQYLLGLFDFPDVEAAVSLATADAEYTDMVISQILDEGRYTPPEPLSNLAFSIKRITNAYLRAKIDGAKEDRLQMLLDYVATAKEMMDQAGVPVGQAQQQAQQQQQQAQQPQPQQVPGVMPNG